MNQFAVNFYSPNGELQSADWRWGSPAWATSYREGISWHTACNSLTPAARQAVLEKFGLVSQDEGVDVSAEYPPEVLQATAPAKLIARRRQIETQLVLSALLVKSDRLGDHVRAEEAA